MRVSLVRCRWPNPLQRSSRDPITSSRKELMEHYRKQAIRYQQLAQRQHRSSICEGLLGIARQCATMADALAGAGTDQSVEPVLSESEILILLQDVIDSAETQSSVPAGCSRSPSVAAAPRRELSLDEILEKVERDIAEGRAAAAD
jgi:hypothetical protein